jgi:hypothetical protein
MIHEPTSAKKRAAAPLHFQDFQWAPYGVEYIGVKISLAGPWLALLE